MRRRSVMVVLTVAVLVLAVTFGVRALIEPYTDEGRAQDYFETRIDALGQHLAKSWRGGRFTAATAEKTKGRVLTAAEKDFAVVLLGAADNGEANWLVLNLLTHYHQDSFGLSFGFRGLADYTVTGCVRFTVNHGQAGWEETDAHLTVRSVPCPPGAPVPVDTYNGFDPADGSRPVSAGATSSAVPSASPGPVRPGVEGTSPAYPGVRVSGPTFRVDDVASRVFPIVPNPVQCRSGGDSSDCPGG
ncbi:MAG TPA: hypothetical protein VLL08_04070 [Kineosporiaceae bacterium]|nr:hypothetical protein [Kineosporiaceae bacterium]